MRKLLTIILLFTILLTHAMVVLAAESITLSTPSGVPFSEIEHQIDTIIAEHLGQTTPGAAVVVINDGEIIFSKGYGYADIERNIPINPASTVFEYGSINKVFVWMAVMQLVEQGLLSLDNDISTYLPNDFVFEKQFTMRDLMNHTAGFGAISFGLIVSRLDSDESLKDALIRLQPDQIFQPGTVSAYSNFGAALAAYVVEYVSGVSYEVFEMENIIVPAGMTNTLNQPDWIHNDDFLEQKAVGYVPDGRGGFAEEIMLHSPIFPTGALNGTAEDLARFAIELTPPTGVISPFFQYYDTLGKMFSPSSLNQTELRGTHHGFLHFGSNPLVIGHGGNTPAFSTAFAVVPYNRFGLVIMTNALDALDIVADIFTLLIGSGLSYVDIIQDNMPNAVNFEGIYVSANRFDGTIAEFFSYFALSRLTAIDENTLLLQLGSSSETYKQIRPYVFQVTTSNTLFSVIANTLHFRMEDGQVSHVMVGNGFDFTPLPQGRTTPFLIGSVVVVLVSAIFLLITPIVILVSYLRRREKFTRFNLISNGTLLCGTLLVLNHVILLIRVLVINIFRSPSEVAPHIWANYGLLFLFVGMLILSVFTIIKGTEIRLRRKVFFGLTVFIQALLYYVLWYWNFFVFL